ncbi:MAG: peptidoglycan DD-metalloendopeptidase family protein [Lachnospiraceae bacterium]|nr:peptidoglycan DD-metalloendopeptidase family protein [Lachnospiraceae bacterium]
MRKTWKLIGLVLVCSMLAVSVPEKMPVSATGSTSATIQQKKDEINKAKEERKKLQQGLSDVKKMVSKLEKSKTSLKNYVKELDSQLSSVQTKIQELKDLISEKEEEIEQTKKELEEAIAIEEKQYEEMKIRIKFMYEKGNHFYLDMMLGASSFGDMLNKAQYVESISAYDRQKLEEFQLNRELIEVCKQELEEEEAMLQEAKTAVEQEQANLEVLIDTKEKEITAFESDIKTQEQAIKEYEEYIREQDETIAALEKALKEMQNSNIKYDGGMFAWPAPSYTRITSEYGWRIHPTLKVNKFHNGVDMGAPGGSPILAAYDGEVVQAGYSSTMGNYIYLNHGSGLVTIYMHASKLYVTKGQVVSKGDKIAAVGTTGRSTGNHLHFGVRLNGEYVSPWNYLK